MQRFTHFIYLTVISALVFLLIGATFKHEHRVTNRLSGPVQVERDMNSGYRTLPEPIANNSAEIEARLGEFDVKGEDSARFESETEQLSLQQQFIQHQEPILTTGQEIAQQIRQQAGRFETESTDQSWSYIAEQNITDLFMNEEALRDFSIDDVECRNETCALTISNLSNEPFLAFMMIQRAAVAQAWYPEGGTTTLQLSENGQPHRILFKLR